jgi:5-enolpyruvylshikimate-3-phosphate synthase
MAFAAGATRAEWPVHIEDTDAVNTSFPGFVACLKSLGVNIAEQQEPTVAVQK